MPANPYRQANFHTGAATLAQAPPDQGWEVAFAGRSNAGKSSAINVLCDQKDLARISKRPGRTQQLNFFLVDSERRLVDLPGYGYAAVPEAVKQSWQGVMRDYLIQRASLKGILLVSDIRQALTDYDRQLLEWGRVRGLAIHLLLSKADKLSRGAAIGVQQRIQAELAKSGLLVSVQRFSSLKKEGILQAHEVLNAWLEIPAEPGPDTLAPESGHGS